MSHIKHHFVSGKADGTDATLVKPTAWNSDHDMTTDADGVVLGRLAGAGAGPVQELPFGAVLPYGTVLPFAGPTAPTGWLICDGSSLLRSDYLSLFNVIGTFYGTVDGAHFNIPDLRGRTIAGMDPTGTRLTTSITPNGNTLGGVGGLQSNAANINIPQLFVRVGYYANPVQPSVAGATFSATTGTPSPPFQNVQDGFTGVATSGHNHVVSGSISWNQTQFGSYGLTDAVANTAAPGYNGTTLFTIVQPTLLMNWIIKT